MDITYIPMARGFVYLAVVLDWFSRRVLSWRLSITMEAAFCVKTLGDALSRHGKADIFNTLSSPARPSPGCSPTTTLIVQDLSHSFLIRWRRRCTKRSANTVCTLCHHSAAS
jgi:transposase InsO family protein